MSSRKDSRRIRLLHVVGDSRYGGAAIIILGLAQVARDEGWHVDILTTDPLFQQAATQQGFGVISLDVIRRPMRPLWDLKGLLRLVGFLHRERYDIVHTHTSKGGFIGRLAARLAGVPRIIHTAHGFAFHENSPFSIRLFYSALERIASPWCDRIVSVSEFHRDWAIRLHMCSPHKLISIPNGIAELRRNPNSDLAELRERLGAGPGDLIILSVARLAADKGLKYLIEAAATLQHSQRRIRFVIAGDGPERSKLERLASGAGVRDRVIFLGFQHDVSDLLAACDIFVSPSLREGLSISLLEAMAAGKPIVATSIGSHQEVAPHGDVAWLVRPADAQALRAGILRVAEDPALMVDLGARARAAYMDYYTDNRMLQSYRRLYSGLLGVHADAGGESGMIRRATPNDLSAIVNMHQRAFSRFFLTQLGGKFLWRYYNLVLHYHSGILLVDEGQGALRGFACGFIDPAEFYRLMWRARLIFAVPVLSALLRHPSLIRQVISGVRRIQSVGAEWPAGSCELSSIAVEPDRAGKGVGKALAEAFLSQAKSMHACCVYLSTDAERNDAANAFYRNVGFQHTRRFLRGRARWMNEYVIKDWEAGDPWQTPA